MHRLTAFLLLTFLALTAAAVVAAQSPPARPGPAQSMQWRSGLTEINENWAVHDGDNLAWAHPGFDDSTWKTVDLEDQGVAQTGWRWYRKHLHTGPEHPNPHLLIDAGDGTYELYVNGILQPGASIRSPFAVKRPVERVFELNHDQNNNQGDFEIALRTRVPANYSVYDMPLFLSVTIGGPVAIEYERASLESERLYLVAPAVAINLLLILAGVGALALYVSQRAQRDYLFLGLFLVLVGIANGTWHLQQTGVAPHAANLLFSDPLIYFYCIAQIEFTFSFARQRVGPGWRIYQAILLLPLLLVPLEWLGRISGDAYVAVEALITAPVAFLLPVLLLLWYRRGNREAGWLIFPSLLPAALGAIYDLGYAATLIGWKSFTFFVETIQIGPIPVYTADIGSLLFLIAIGIVMFFRFTRVSREQARAAAELDAAREVQELLVAPAKDLPGFKIESAYLPAKQVGGDFFRVLPGQDGSVLVVSGDVSGKGLKAAMTVSAIMGALRGCPSRQPAEILAYLNQVLYGQVSGFVTCCVALITRDGTITLANAGNPAPYCNGEEIAVEPGLPLGMIAEAAYAETQSQIASGDQLTFVSDGVIEATSPSGELYGFDRTQAISTQSAAQIAEAVQHFGQEDDITVLTVTREPA